MNKANSCKNDGTLKECFVIKRNRLYFTILDPWNRGFYNTPDPKRFASLREAEAFLKENRIDDGKIKIEEGWFTPSQGYFPGKFPG